MAKTSKKTVTDLHSISAGEPVTYEVSGHPPRADSPEYVKTRAALKKICQTLGTSWYYAHGSEPYQDHHGGGLWLKDSSGWFFVRNLVGMEWSSQFCADPRKVDELRRNAQRLYAAFPDTLTAMVNELGLKDVQTVLSTPITDPEGVARWTDSIFNASVPLPQRYHTGAVPQGAGVHNYPSPVCEIDRFRRDDFELWVTDSQGKPAAVVPKTGDPKDGVRVVHSTPGTQLHQAHQKAEKSEKHLELPGTHPLSKQAFARWGKSAHGHAPLKKAG